MVFMGVEVVLFEEVLQFDPVLEGSVEESPKIDVWLLGDRHGHSLIAFDCLEGRGRPSHSYAG
jgi:hypothetical protein